MNNKIDGATVTEAHRKLAADLCRSATGSNRALHHVPKFAQLIADSEARAVEKLHAEANNSEAKTTMKPSNAPTLQWTHELHEDYYVLNRGDVQVGILFPDTGMPVGYIRHFVATLNAYYPTEPGTRFPCGSTDTARAERAEAELATAPITEAHKQLAREIMFGSSPEAASTLAHHVAQLIADNEAKVTKVLWEVMAERDQLRAERDALLEIAWLDTPDEPHETVAQWRVEFGKGWERKAVCDQLRAELAESKNVALATAYAFANATARIRALVGAIETDPLPAEHYVAEALGKLRAEVRAVLKIVNEQTARAELAEAEVERLREQQIADAKSANESISFLKARAERAEAKLKSLVDSL